jgi:hypothetical protein
MVALIHQTMLEAKGLSYHKYQQLLQMLYTTERETCNLMAVLGPL